MAPAPSPVLRLMRLAPPVVALAVLGAVAWAVATHSDRAPREASIRTRWASRLEFESVAADAAAYLRDYGQDEDARWFAVEAFARVEAPVKAFDAAFGREAGRTRAATRARLAALLARTLAGTPEARTVMSPRLLLARFEGGDATAEDVRRALMELVPDQFVSWFVPAHRSRTSATQTVAEVFLGRPEPASKLAGTILSVAPGSGIAIDPLLGALATSFRYERRPTWRQICRSLGACGEPRALAALRTERERLGAASFDGAESIDDDRFALDVGLALAGDDAARARVEAGLEQGPRFEWGGVLYAEGLEVRAAAGEREAYDRLVSIFDRMPLSLVRLQVFYGLALSDVPPPADVPMDRLAQVLLDSGDEFHGVLAHLWAYRNGAPGAVEATERDLRKALADPQSTQAIADGESVGSATVYETLRAWMRWKR